eukprot:258647-Pelagomonas_calceolata.AAC.1
MARRVNPYFFKVIQGLGSIDSPTHTQEDCVESDLFTLKGLAQLTNKLAKCHHWVSSLPLKLCLFIMMGRPFLSP